MAKFKMSISGRPLYIALYARGGKSTMPGREDKYHWAFMVGPEKESKGNRGKRFHVKRVLSLLGDPPTAEFYWDFEEIDISMEPTSMILARVLIGRVKDLTRFRLVLWRTPLQQEVKAWNWVDWIEEAFHGAIQDSEALETYITDWAVIKETAMRYVELKRLARRFDGTRAYDFTKVPTWDMLRGAETIP